MANPDNLIGNGFDSKPENINKAGRPKRIYTIIKEMGYSSDDMKAVFKELSWYSESNLKAIYDDKKKPIITRIVANQLYKALSGSDFGKIREILEYAIGKPANIVIENKNTMIQVEDGINWEKLKESTLRDIAKNSDEQSEENTK